MNGGKISGQDVRIAAQDITVDVNSNVDTKGLGVPAEALANVRTCAVLCDTVCVDDLCAGICRHEYVVIV
jgi:hypothetical protein